MFIKRVLVTGGAAFIGSHTCEELLSRGMEVLSLDNLLTGGKSAQAVSVSASCGQQLPAENRTRRSGLHPYAAEEVPWVERSHG